MPKKKLIPILKDWKDFPTWDSLLIQHLNEWFGGTLFDPFHVSNRYAHKAACFVNEKIGPGIREDLERLEPRLCFVIPRDPGYCKTLNGSFELYKLLTDLVCKRVEFIYGWCTWLITHLNYSGIPGMVEVTR